MSQVDCQTARDMAFSVDIKARWPLAGTVCRVGKISLRRAAVALSEVRGGDGVPGAESAARPTHISIDHRPPLSRQSILRAGGDDDSAAVAVETARWRRRRYGQETEGQCHWRLPGGVGAWRLRGPSHYIHVAVTGASEGQAVRLLRCVPDCGPPPGQWRCSCLPMH